jgi:hypothetical protein
MPHKLDAFWRRIHALTVTSRMTMAAVQFATRRVPLAVEQVLWCLYYRVLLHLIISRPNTMWNMFGRLQKSLTWILSIVLQSATIKRRWHSSLWRLHQGVHSAGCRRIWFPISELFCCGWWCFPSYATVLESSKGLLLSNRRKIWQNQWIEYGVSKYLF